MGNLRYVNGFLGSDDGTYLNKYYEENNITPSNLSLGLNKEIN